MSRQGIVVIDREIMLDMVAPGLRQRGYNPNAVIYDIERDSFMIKVDSPDLPETEPGKLLPILDIILKKQEDGFVEIVDIIVR